MARPLFEQYKDALRRGHVALLGDELEAALEAYREAASLVPGRPLPYASMATALARLGRRQEALEAFDQAIGIAPEDEATLRARDALLGDLEGAGTGAAEAPAGAEAPTGAVTEAAEPEVDVVAAREGVGEVAAIEEIPTAVPPEPTEPQPVPDDPGAAAAPGGDWPAIDLPSPPPPPLVGPPPDPAVLQAEANAFIDAGDPASARDPLLVEMAVHREAGRLDAALDACLQLLAIVPGDPRVHLAMANLQLDRGWRSVATEKIELLLRLTSLSGDARAEADVHLLAAERLRDESPARLDARRRGASAP